MAAPVAEVPLFARGGASPRRQRPMSPSKSSSNRRPSPSPSSSSSSSSRHSHPLKQQQSPRKKEKNDIPLPVSPLASRSFNYDGKLRASRPSSSKPGQSISPVPSSLLSTIDPDGQWIIISKDMSMTDTTTCAVVNIQLDETKTVGRLELAWNDKKISRTMFRLACTSDGSINVNWVGNIQALYKDRVNGMSSYEKMEKDTPIDGTDKMSIKLNSRYLFILRLKELYFQEEKKTKAGGRSRTAEKVRVKKNAAFKTFDSSENKFCELYGSSDGKEKEEKDKKEERGSKRGSAIRGKSNIRVKATSPGKKLKQNASPLHVIKSPPSSPTSHQMISSPRQTPPSSPISSHVVTRTSPVASHGSSPSSSSGSSISFVRGCGSPTPDLPLPHSPSSSSSSSSTTPSSSSSSCSSPSVSGGEKKVLRVYFEETPVTRRLFLNQSFKAVPVDSKTSLEMLHSRLLKMIFRSVHESGERKILENILADWGFYATVDYNQLETRVDEGWSCLDLCSPKLKIVFKGSESEEPKKKANIIALIDAADQD